MADLEPVIFSGITVIPLIQSPVILNGITRSHSAGLAGHFERDYAAMQPPNVVFGGNSKAIMFGRVCKTTRFNRLEAWFIDFCPLGENVSFKSWRSYWNFRQSILSKQRYIQDKDSKDFLDSIVKTCKSRERTLNAGFTTWRAQNGHLLKPYYQHDPDTNQDILVDNIPCPFLHERMKPLVGSAIEGRANPKGIPCLYLSTNKETAMSEVRPWIGGILSVARFRLLKDIKFIDFSIGDISNKRHLYLNEPTDEEKVEAVWSHIDNAFSKPIKPSDNTSDYAPTQIISELIRTNGYDGIAYKSSLASGYNLALFDLDSAEVVDCLLFEASKIEFTFNIVQEFE